MIIVIRAIIESALPFTLLLFGFAAVVSFLIGIPLGILTSWFRGTKKEGSLVYSGTILNAIPFFVLAVLLIVYFAAKYPIFPVRSSFPLTWIKSTME